MSKMHNRHAAERAERKKLIIKQLRTMTYAEVAALHEITVQRVSKIKTDWEAQHGTQLRQQNARRSTSSS